MLVRVPTARIKVFNVYSKASTSGGSKQIYKVEMFEVLPITRPNVLQRDGMTIFAGRFHP